MQRDNGGLLYSTCRFLGIRENCPTGERDGYVGLEVDSNECLALPGRCMMERHFASPGSQLAVVQRRFGLGQDVLEIGV